MNDCVNGQSVFTYDAFNRLLTACKGTSCTGSSQAYSYSYPNGNSGYDEYGNRWRQRLTSGTGYDVSPSFNPSNRITTSAYAYDVAGNMTSNGSCSPCWTYDVLSKLTGGGNATFVYDGLGNRIEKTQSNGTQLDFAIGQDGRAYNEFQGTIWTRTTAGLFTYADNTTYFNRTDNLGTPRLSTDYTGATQRTETSGPFGDGFSESMSTLDFTGFADGDWDSENNAVHGAREYRNTEGRWLQPDPAGLAAVDPTNPQTWNRYAYVTNNPVSFADPSGFNLMAACFGHCGSNGGQGSTTDPNFSFSPTGNGSVWSAGLAGAFIPIYGWLGDSRWMISYMAFAGQQLSMLGGIGPGGAKPPCKSAKTYPIPQEWQNAALNSQGWTITSISSTSDSFAPNTITGFELANLTPMNFGGLRLPANSRLTVQAAPGGFTMNVSGSTGYLSLPTDTWYSVGVNYLQFANDEFTNVNGEAMGIPGSSMAGSLVSFFGIDINQRIQNGLNNNPDAISGAGGIASALNNCIF